MTPTSTQKTVFSPLTPPKFTTACERQLWCRLIPPADCMALAQLANQGKQTLLVVVSDVAEANRVRQELNFFLDNPDIPVLLFPDWETLPYDHFSPLPELISQRLLTLYRMPDSSGGILVVPVSTLMQRLPPKSFVMSHSLVLTKGQRLNLEEMRLRLEHSGYLCVPQVVEHGEFAVRGSLLDIFPMGSDLPLRIDLFDDEIESLRTFNPENQRSISKLDRIEMLPAREFPMDEAAIARFRTAYRNQFEGDPQRSLIYRGISEGTTPGGIEYYLPLFFEQLDTLFDYLPKDLRVFEQQGIRQAAETFYQQVTERFEERNGDLERPLLAPNQLYLQTQELAAQLNTLGGVTWQANKIDHRRKGFARQANFDCQPLPPLSIQARHAEPVAQFRRYLDTTANRILILAESAGRREVVLETLKGFGLSPTPVAHWREFLQSNAKLAITVAPISQGCILEGEGLTLIGEEQLLGGRVRQESRSRIRRRDADQVVRNLTELHIGAPVVHEEHGVGRYLGLQTLETGGMRSEFLTLEYDRGDKLYVPVSSLHLISRYSGASPEAAPLHRLGSGQWEKAKRKASERVRDVAAELLDIYARREARRGHAFPQPGEEYAQFSSSFEFEETPDQARAIEAVLSDMSSPRPMDRVICGDVGFGKTEVAMRAAFMAVQGGRQVALLVPTTLLAQQHLDNFRDRFADWPIRIEGLSRFGGGKQQQTVAHGLADGTIDIVIGTHKLLQSGIEFKRLGLVIIDEEHRFGVRHKEHLKSLRSEVDILTLTATPIPRTLNMAMSGMRDLSVISTPPVARHPINTFTSQWNDSLIIEACQREIKRGGQIYFLHNEVSTISNMADRLQKLLPEARIRFAHGQMRERELEQIMRDFYHQRFQILVCTTIIESGIDVPSANTIIINRADKLGLAQLHQLRGRVGRSHHRAYAYLLTPDPRAMSADARKRLEAIESLEDLGAGFTLASHDLEIRGAGELLGSDQSGQIHEIGFTLYSELLERTVQALKNGETINFERSLHHGCDIDLQLPALIPDDYLPDVHTRLVLYKRIASAENEDELRELQVEMIDRFGLLPEPAKNLFTLTQLKLRLSPLGVKKLEVGPSGGRLVFSTQPNIDPATIIRLIQSHPREYKLDGGECLRFFHDMERPEQRIQAVHRLIDNLCP